jgi:hypothetical protein
MKLAHASKNLIVYDGVMEANAHAVLWKWVQQEEYAPANAVSWQKVCRLTDCNTMLGRKWRGGPWNNGLDICAYYVIEIAKHHKDHFGDDWSEITYQSHVLPRNSKSSWQGGLDKYPTAILFTHPRWSPEWGGELLVAEVPESYDATTQETGRHLTHEWWDGYLSEVGVGISVQAKPNRIVLMPAGTWHMTTRVDPDAGDNPLCFVTAQFGRPNPAG